MESWQDTEGLVFWIWFTVCLFIGLIFFIVLILRISFKSILQNEKRLSASILEHQKELLKTSILIQEKERNRIAQDIHDGLVSELNIIRLSNKSDVKAINEKLKQCIKTVRLISHDLMPPLIEETLLEELLTEIVLGLEAENEVHTHQAIHKNHEIEGNIKLQLVRIVQEVTTNIAKHASANKVVFLLRISKNYIALKIEDNGVGFQDGNVSGLGLKNIVARTQLLNGVQKFKSIPNIKTRFLLIIPLN